MANFYLSEPHKFAHIKDRLSTTLECWLTNRLGGEIDYELISQFSKKINDEFDTLIGELLEIPTSNNKINRHTNDIQGDSRTNA